MNEPLPHDWSDLTTLWQAEAAGISVREIEDYLRRERRRARIGVLADLAVGGIALIVAGWLMLYSYRFWLGALIALGAGASAMAAWRVRRTPPSIGSSDLRQSLKEIIAREDWLIEQLQMGRALNFTAMFAVVFVTATQLLRHQDFASVPWLTLGIAGAAIGGVLAWNLVLSRRARRRRDRLRYFNDRFEA